MKELRCNVCMKYLGEIKKGRVLKGTAFYCTTCEKNIKALKLAKSAQDMQGAQANQNMTSFFEELMKYKK